MKLESSKRAVLANQDKYYRMARVILNNHDEAQDVLQDMYLKLWADEKVLVNVNNPEAYAMRMIRNLSLDRLRKKKKFTTQNESHDSPDQEMYQPFQTLSFQNLKELMIQLFNTLPDQQRDIIYLRDIEQYTYDEIAEVTGLTINNIRVNLSRARKDVRKNYLKIKNYEQGRD